MYQWLLADLGLEQVTLVGLGLGGWIAAEMATMAPRGFRRLVLVGAMGIQPTEGEILDQALVNYIQYARAGFHDQAAFDAGLRRRAIDTDQLEAWDINREMTFRIAWKPYLYSQTLPHLLGGVQAPALVVWGADDRIVPRSCGEQYVQALPQARLEIVEDCGHCVEMERPAELAAADRAVRRIVSARGRGVMPRGAPRLASRPSGEETHHAPDVLHRAADVVVPGRRGAEVRRTRR